MDLGPHNIKILPNIPSANNPQDLTLKIKTNSYPSHEIDDMTRLCLALARTKFLGKINQDLPIIRSATNTPGPKSTRATKYRKMLRNNLPIFRSSEIVQEETLPVIRSATNVPRSKLFMTKPINSLNFLASRMRLMY